MTAIQAPTDTSSAMEEIHGVDVSWLHHSTRDHHHRQQAPSSPGLTKDAPPKTSSHGGIPARPRNDEQQQTPEPKPATNRPASPPRPTPPPAAPAPAATATATPSQKTPLKRPALLSRGSAEKNVNGTTPPESRSTSRRGSWMTSFSSKFSSQNSPAQTTHTQAQGSHAALHGAANSSSANGALNGIQAASGGNHAASEPYVPQPPKSSFVGNVLRRLSSGSQISAAGKVYPNGGMCPRKVMNVDQKRERCLVPELDQNKLRKVAFCVDVEIAAGPKYKDDVDTNEKQPKRKDKKMKERGEGEALKNPEAVAEQKDKSGVVSIAQEAVGNEKEPNPEGTVIEDKQEISKKKEKKKRSEAERKERKEKKRRKAEENGTIPLELTRDDDNGSAEGVPPASGTAAPRAQDRPTIDPLRIYRRCCQLRESPILKRISDQLAAPRACAVVQPGVVTCLDLTGSRLQLADVLTLSDWLAIVPVKKLFLEDADLTDEKIRVILAGLLAAKVPEPPKRRSQSSDGTQDGLCQQGSCAVKKLVLKNNPKITAEGWKHIALFLYMCKSIMAVDVSMIPFPNAQPQLASPQSTDSTQASSSNKDGKSGDIAEIFSKAISERLGGSELQELAMAECNLTSQSIRKIIDGCIVSGIQRLSLATNDLDAEGLEHVLQYLRSGVCQGLDLGGNDLRSWIGQLGESISQCKNCPLWALCLQDTGLTPESLRTLLPILVSLPSFKFLDLSHNRGLFSGQTALCLLRKYMPQFKELKRIHLMNVDMKLEDAISIAEILPDCPQIAHINILENPEITRVATSTDEETQEDAAALYASLTLAAKLSKSLICVDVDIPAPGQSEVIKALAKQVVAYCLRNIESINEVPELRAAPKEVEVPKILMRLVAPDDADGKENDESSSAADNDYIVGGTGIAKALSYCLSNKESNVRRMSASASGTSTPRSRSRVPVLEEPSKARAMSKDLLDTARNTRSRIQPALIREAKGGNDINYRRLLFLDQTLQGMIQRFEDEYPETRLQPSDAVSTSSSIPSTSPPTSAVPTLENSAVSDMTAPESDEDDPPTTIRSRHNSDVSLASRHMSLEEGRLHRFGHRVRTGLLNTSRPTTPDGVKNPSSMISGTADDEGLPEHIMALREYFQNHSGDEMRQMIEGKGWEEAFNSIVENAEELKNLEKDDPQHFKIFMDSQIAALKNRNPDIHAPGDKDVKSNGHDDGDDFAVED